MPPRQAVFFDRDGVLNQAVVADGRPSPPADAESLVVTRGARGLLWELKELRFLLICVTNQPDIARGTRTAADVEAMNRKVSFALTLDDLYCCPHDGPDNCQCRKPKPGMILAAADKWGVDLPASWTVGDRAGDIAAGRAAGTRTIFLDFGYREPGPEPPADHTCRNLAEAVRIIKEASVSDETFKRFEGEVVR